MIRSPRPPRGLSRSMRRLLEHHSRGLTQLHDQAAAGFGGGSIDIDAITAKVIDRLEGSAGANKASGPVAVKRVYVPGAAVQNALPEGLPGDVVIVEYGEAGIQAHTDPRLRLGGDYDHGKHALLALQWNGQTWVELARKGGTRTLLNVQDFGAIGNGDPCETEVQHAFDLLEEDVINATSASAQTSGGVVFFPKSNKGTYLFNETVVIRSSNTLVLFEEGVIIHNDTDSGGAAFNVQGYLDTTKQINHTTANQGSLTISVTPGDEANFSVDDWLLISDGTATYDGASATHDELVRVRALASGTITLYWPLTDNYNTATRTLTLVRGRQDQTRAIPHNVAFKGGAYIRNNDGTSAEGGSGIRLQYCHDVIIEGVTFDACRTEGVKVLQSTGVKIANCKFQNATIFTGSVGYGVTTTASSHILVTHCTFERMRHAIDFSYFSRHCSGVQNQVRASGSHGLMMHPNTKYCSYVANHIEGTVGNDSGSASGTELTTTTGAGNEFGAAINIGQAAQFAKVAFNTIQQSVASGIWLHTDESSNCIIEGNIIHNANTGDLTTAPFGGIVAVQDSAATPDLTGGGLIIRNNIVQTSNRYGIVAGADDLVIEGNYVRDITGGPAINVRTYAAGGGGSEQTVSRVRVSGNYVHTVSGNNRSSGIAVQHVDGAPGVAVESCLIEDNYVYAADYHGIVIEQIAQADIITIKGNYVVDCNTTGSAASYGGISVAEWASGDATNHRDIDVTGNVVVNCRNNIYVGLEYARITNNVLLNSAFFGIFVNNRHTTGGDIVRGVVLDSNFIYNCNWGIYYGSSLAGTESGIVRHNVIIQSSTDGIYIRAGVPNAIVWGNHVEGCGGDAIQIDGDNAVVANNTLVDHQGTPTQDYGIRIAAGADGTQLWGNHFYGNVTGPFTDAGTNTIWLDRMIPVTWWGVDPTNSDNTTEMQAAIDNCPSGCVLYVPPGQYLFTGTGGLTWGSTDGLAGIWAYGAVFDWGTTSLTDYALQITHRPDFETSTGFLRGLCITRTAGTAPTSSSHTGLKLLACVHFHVEDVKIAFFRQAIELEGGTSQGCVMNKFFNTHTTNAWKHLYLHPGTNGGWCNENTFYGHRVQQSITDATERQSIDALVTIEYEATASFIPNNNAFIHCNFESTGTIEGGIRVEGTENKFLYCRYEGIDSADFPIEIGNSSYANTSFARNVFLYGRYLDTLMGTEAHITFTDSSSTGVNNGNVFKASKSLVSTTSNYTIKRIVQTVYGDATTAGISIFLPPAAAHKNERYTIIKIDASGNAVTVDGDASETINGSTTHALSTQYDVVEVESDGSAWVIV